MGAGVGTRAGVEAQEIIGIRVLVLLLLVGALLASSSLLTGKEFWQKLQQVRG